MSLTLYMQNLEIRIKLLTKGLLSFCREIPRTAHAE